MQALTIAMMHRDHLSNVALHLSSDLLMARAAPALLFYSLAGELERWADHGLLED